MEEVVVAVRHVDAVEGGQVGGLSDVIDDDAGSMLRRVGELVDELLGDELVHPYASIRKIYARKSGIHGGAPFSCVWKALRPGCPSLLQTFTRTLKGRMRSGQTSTIHTSSCLFGPLY